MTKKTLGSRGRGLFSEGWLKHLYQENAPVKLVVSKGSHVLVEQSGQWLK